VCAADRGNPQRDGLSGALTRYVISGLLPARGIGIDVLVVELVLQLALLRRRLSCIPGLGGLVAVGLLIHLTSSFPGQLRNCRILTVSLACFSGA
jgi:hypothetical protein